MRFLELVLVVIAAIYAAQLLLTSLVIAMPLMLLWCLYKRPKEALIFVGLILLAGAFAVQPVAFIALAALVAGFYVAMVWWRRRVKKPRPMPLLECRKQGGS